METDRPIEALFERQGQSLLPFVGETAPGVRVAAVEAVELALPGWRLTRVVSSDNIPEAGRW